MKLTLDQRQIILEIDSISKMKTVETWEERWKEYIVENAKFFETRKTLHDFRLPASRNKDTLAIIGPSASVTQYASRLDELRDVCTICVLPTALQWSYTNGLKPDMVVIQDSGHAESSFFPPGDYPVIGPTTLNPKVVEQQDPYLFTLLMGNGSTKAPGFGEWNTWCLQQDADLDGGIVSMGCVTNLAISVIELFRLAGQLRAKRVVLFGQDFGGWKGQSRAVEPFGNPARSIEDLMNDDTWVRWNGYDTDPRMIWYKFKLLNLWRRISTPLYSCSEGMLTELPYVKFDDILRGKFPKQPRVKQREEMFTEFSALMADTFPREDDEG